MLIVPVWERAVRAGAGRCRRVCGICWPPVESWGSSRCWHTGPPGDPLPPIAAAAGSSAGRWE